MKTTYASRDEIQQRLLHLKSHSLYPNMASDFFSQYDAIPEMQWPHGVPTLINAAQDCSQCFYGLQLDSYINGCTHDCSYCWAKTELSKVNKWNSPAPEPIDISAFWNLFYTVFETDQDHPLKKILLRRTPLRLGALSDPFLSYEKKQGLTYELIKILNYYKYPHVLLTRSSLVASEKYLTILNPELASVQMSIPSAHEKLVRILEPGADAPQKRLQALKDLNAQKIWSSVRINPLFPTHHDGYWQSLKIGGAPQATQFNFFDMSLLDQIAATNTKALLVGFVHMDQKTTEVLSRKVGFDLRSLMSESLRQQHAGLKFSTDEIRCYYENIAERSQQLNLQFSTCYLGLGESFYWKDQDLWADKKDCCNIKKNVKSFVTDTQQISLKERYKIVTPEASALSVALFPTWLYQMKSLFIKKLWD